MEATCQYVTDVQYVPNTYDGKIITVCGAPIPRLEEGPCERCTHHHRSFHTATGCYYLNDNDKMCECTGYIGPLASECTAGHPVAVQTEAERRRA